MTEVLWPPDLIPSSQTWGNVGNVATFNSTFTRASKNYGRPGAQKSCTIIMPPVKGEPRARMRARLAELKDRAGSIWVPDFSTTLETGLPVRGSFAANEAFTNHNFANNTTGWTAENVTLSVADRVMRVAAASAATHDFYQNVALTQYAPYALRTFIRDGAQTSGLNIGPSISAGAASSLGTARGLLSVANTTTSAASQAHYPALASSASGYTVGAYFDVFWTSLARCISVDGGGNLLLYSDQINNAAWTKSAASAGTNDYTAPDGTATADGVVEDSSNGSHYIMQSGARSAGVVDLCSYGYFKRAAGTRNVRLLCGNDGSDYGSAIFDLGAGTFGTVANAGSATNARAFMVAAGDGWYYCAVVARCPTAITARMYVEMASGTSTSYAGNGTSAVAMWRLGMALSSLPTRGTQSTSAAVTAATQTGSGIYVKGLPASTNGLLESGDFVQIGGQINTVVSRLNSDAAGRGYLLCGNPWRAATNDAAAFVNTPMCKMQIVSDTIDIETGPGQFSSFQLELVEVIE